MIARARTGAQEGLWIRAVRQSAGRGRLGRAWESATGNLFASTLVRLQNGDPPASTLAFVAGLAAHRTIAEHIPEYPTELKWPNDILVRNRKICGMLLERVEDAVIVGIGINIASAPEIEGRKLTCLQAECVSSGLTADMLVEELAANFAVQCHDWRTLPLSSLLDKWCTNAHKTGTDIQVSQNANDRLSGKFAGLSQDGSLRLLTGDGTMHVIHAGDVELIRDIER